VTEIDDEDYRFYARVFTVVTTGVLAFILYKIIAPFLGPLMWAVFLAFLLHPLHVRLTRQLKGRSNLSASLITIATFVMLIGPLAGLSAAFVAQAADLVQWVQDALAKQTRQQYNVLSNAPVIGSILDWLHDTFGVQTAQMQSWLAQATKYLPQFLAGLGGKIFLGAVNTVLAFVVMLFMLFFFVRDGAGAVTKLRALIPMPPARRELLADHIAAVTRAVVFGTGITALVQGTLVCIAFLITDLSSPLVFGVIAALLALLPIGGTAIVWIPALFVLMSQNKWGMAVVMLIIGVMSSSADNVLRPLLISGRAQVGTLTVFIGVLGGTAAFGPIGLFLGPVLLALIIALINFALEIRRSA
jgi:predicted PurR-regulated permease PerM